MKRKCGTCRWFEDRGVAGSGVCQHIQRRELRDVVLVRQTELACRNSWDQDLWEPSPNPVLNPALLTGEHEERDIVFDSVPADLNRATGRKESDENEPLEDDPHTEKQIRHAMPPPLTTRSRGVLRPFVGTDEARENTDAAWPDLPNVREARRRLELERQRSRQQEHESQVAGIGKGLESGEAIDGDAGLKRSASSRAAANARSQPVPHEVAPPPGDLNDDLVPRQPERREPLRGPAVATPGPRNGSYQAPVASLEQRQATEPLPTVEVRRGIQDGTRPMPFAGSGVPVVPPPDQLDEPVVHVDGTVPFPTSPPVARGQSTGLGTPDTEDPIDRDKRVAAIPRMCGTCRDFRQVGDGERGQCVNAYAFGDRRMVKSDQLACRSSLGTWWMPNDDLWLEKADTSHHGRPTPLLDATLRAQRSGDDGRDSHA